MDREWTSCTSVKWSLDRDALLRIDFYTPENLKRFFGAAAPVFRTPTSWQAQWVSRGPDAMCRYEAGLIHNPNSSPKSAMLTQQSEI
jgi:hypothetical protein